MGIEQVQSFRVTDGRCFEHKQDAYREEIIALYRLIPRPDEKAGFGPAVFCKLIESMKIWVASAESVAKQMNLELDGEVKKKVQG